MLDDRLAQPIITRMKFGQSLVNARLPSWDSVSRIRLSFLCALALAVTACANSAEKAAAEAALAQQLFNNGDLPGARMAVTRSLALRSDNQDVLLLDARIKLQMGDLTAAYEAYRTTLVFAPDNLEALVMVARIGSINGDKRNARDALRRGLAIDPKQPDLLMVSGIEALTRKEFGAALEVSERLLAANPGNSPGLALKARALSEMGRAADGYALLRGQIEKAGNDPILAGALLEIARAQSDVPVMLEQFPILFQTYPNSVDLALDEINVRYKSGDADSARTAALDLISRFGNDVSAMTRLLELWNEYDRTPLSQADIGALAGEGAVEARLAIGRFLGQNGDLASAAALVGGSVDPRLLGLAAWIDVRRGNPAGFERAQTIASKDRTNCEALTAVAEWKIAKRRYEQAIVDAQVVASDCRDRVDGYLLLADAYERADRPVSVERVLREGIEAHPLDLALTKRLARWLLAKGRAQSAVSAARRLTNAAPARVSSWQAYSEICTSAGNSACAGDAAAGRAAATRSYVLDAPSARRPDPLFGRSWR